MYSNACEKKQYDWKLKLNVESHSACAGDSVRRLKSLFLERSLALLLISLLSKLVGSI